MVKHRYRTTISLTHEYTFFILDAEARDLGSTSSYNGFTKRSYNVIIFVIFNTLYFAYNTIV